MSKQTTPYNEAGIGLLLMLFGAIIGQRSERLWWTRHNSPVEPWQSQIIFWGFFLGGLFLIAHAIVRN